MSTEYIITTKSQKYQATFAATDPESLNNRTRGDTATFDLQVDDPELVVQSGETYTVESGTTEIYENADIDGTLVIDGELIVYGTVDNDGTITTNGTFTINSGTANTLENLLDFDRHAGSYALRTTLNNTAKYKQQLPTKSNVDSLVIALEPAQSLQDEDIVGKWGLISNVTDNRTRALTNPIITVEIDILADLSEYSDHTAIENDLEI